jgi:hypothetical protein
MGRRGRDFGSCDPVAAGVLKEVGTGVGARGGKEGMRRVICWVWVEKGIHAPRV